MKPTHFLLIPAFAAAILVIIMAGKASAAPCCANPYSQLPLCIESQQIITPETCCSEDYYIAGAEGLPKDRQDCLDNYYSNNGCYELGEKCAAGCCLREEQNTCQENVAYIDCDAKFSAAFGGLCMKDGKYAIEGCETGCCCNGRNGVVGLRGTCMQTSKFYQNITVQPECSRLCAASAEQPLIPLHVQPENKTKPCNELPEKEECLKSNCYWCPEAGCSFDCTTCKYQYDSFPEKPDRVCDDLCMGMACGQGLYCKAGRCFQLPGKKSSFSVPEFFAIFIIILALAVFIVSSKIKSQK